MGLNFRSVIRTTGIFLAILGIAMLPSLLVSLIFREYRMAGIFAVCAGVTAAAGFLLFRSIRPTDEPLRNRDGMLLVSVCWLLASSAGALPFLLSGALPGFCDAFFEAASGFSTTGASVLTDVEALSRGLLFWRSFTHWLGGMGILVFVVAALPALGPGSFLLTRSESSASLTEKLLPRTSDAARLLCLIYLIMTGLLFGLLIAGRMDPFDAAIHTFGTVGTGGFSSYNDGIAHFNDAYVDWVVAVFMILTAVNFNLYYWLLSRHWRDFFQDEELRWFLTIVAGVALLIALNLFFFGAYDSVGQNLRYAVFHTASTITTTGYTHQNYDLWPTFSRMLLFLLLFVGGCASSTAGGIKVVRIVVLMKLIRRNLSRRLHPHAIVPIRLDDRPVPADIVSSITGFAFLYLVVLFAGTLVVTLSGADLLTSASAVASCLGNVGPGFAAAGPAMNYAFFPAVIKLFLGLLMIVGRLELLTVILLFTPQYWHNDR